jgi:hypothetical protein
LTAVGFVTTENDINYFPNGLTLTEEQLGEIDSLRPLSPNQPDPLLPTAA